MVRNVNIALSRPRTVRSRVAAGAFGLIALLSPVTSRADSRAPSIWTEQSSSIEPTQLPLGDKKYSNSPKKGFVFPCNQKSYSGTLGAHVFGPWIHGSTWDATQKLSVQGEVYWPQAVYRITVEGNLRVFAGNELPLNEPTGIFPIKRSDPAYAIDTNPNPIRPQSTSFSVPLNPTEAPSPSCVSIAMVGFSLNGVSFYSALDVQGHDAPAHEVQDVCSGHPRPGGAYHYHSLSDCIPHIRERNALVGYALDGFGIFSPYDADGRELTTDDLDECHGKTSLIQWDGKEVNMYHYVLTRDYPYTIGCFRGIPTRVPITPSSYFGRFMKWLWDLRHK
ncbi:YHYH protein [Bradyrhizobium sp. ORS 111]|uniref:YHYH protein n=1 Tax=Bradyrhizobium sp. ORS 111 TaxID=1685958 RepID=UPI00389032A5